MTELVARTRDGQRFLKREAENLARFESLDNRVTITDRKGRRWVGETENAAIKRYLAGLSEAEPVEPSADEHHSLGVALALAKAFDHLNTALFDCSLPVPVITVHRKRGAHGYFWAERWAKGERTGLHEIALNPETMGRDPRAVISTLAHEMVHLWQEVHGKPSKNAHHNTEWAQMMDHIGLTPTSTGQPGGKRTGRNVTHMIVDDGPFDRAYKELELGGFRLGLRAVPPMKLGKPKDRTKTLFVCPKCGQKAWANYTAKLVCGHDGAKMEAQW